MINLYLIRNCGCDDTTHGLARMTDEQLSFLKNIIEDLNKNSTYSCMPTIDVYKIDEDLLREATDEDSKENVLHLGDCKYALKDRWCVWQDDFEARKVIG